MVPFKKKKQSLSFQNYGKEVKQQNFKFIITMMKSLILYKTKKINLSFKGNNFIYQNKFVKKIFYIAA